VRLSVAVAVCCNLLHCGAACRSVVQYCSVLDVCLSVTVGVCCSVV